MQRMARRWLPLLAWVLLASALASMTSGGTGDSEAPVSRLCLNVKCEENMRDSIVTGLKLTIASFAIGFAYALTNEPNANAKHALC